MLEKKQMFLYLYATDENIVQGIMKFGYVWGSNDAENKISLV